MKPATQRFRVTAEFDLPVDSDSCPTADRWSETLVKHGATNVKVAVWSLASHAISDDKKDRP